MARMTLSSNQLQEMENSAWLVGRFAWSLTNAMAQTIRPLKLSRYCSPLSRPRGSLALPWTELGCRLCLYSQRYMLVNRRGVHETDLSKLGCLPIFLPCPSVLFSHFTYTKAVERQVRPRRPSQNGHTGRVGPIHSQSSTTSSSSNSNLT
jgi:hypothetical protein